MIYHDYLIGRDGCLIVHDACRLVRLVLRFSRVVPLQDDGVVYLVLQVFYVMFDIQFWIFLILKRPHTSHVIESVIYLLVCAIPT